MDTDQAAHASLSFTHASIDIFMCSAIYMTILWQKILSIFSSAKCFVFVFLGSLGRLKFNKSNICVYGILTVIENINLF